MLNSYGISTTGQEKGDLLILVTAWTSLTNVNINNLFLYFQEKKSYHYKIGFFLFNLGCFMMAIYLYFRHNTYCEPGGKFIFYKNILFCIICLFFCNPFHSWNSLGKINIMVHDFFCFCKYYFYSWNRKKRLNINHFLQCIKF